MQGCYLIWPEQPKLNESQVGVSTLLDGTDLADNRFHPRLLDLYMYRRLSDPEVIYPPRVGLAPRTSGWDLASRQLWWKIEFRRQ